MAKRILPQLEITAAFFPTEKFVPSRQYRGTIRRRQASIHGDVEQYPPHQRADRRQHETSQYPHHRRADHARRHRFFSLVRSPLDRRHRCLGRRKDPQRPAADAPAQPGLLGRGVPGQSALRGHRPVALLSERVGAAGRARRGAGRGGGRTRPHGARGMRPQGHPLRDHDHVGICRDGRGGCGGAGTAARDRASTASPWSAPTARA